MKHRVTLLAALGAAAALLGLAGVYVFAPQDKSETAQHIETVPRAEVRAQERAEAATPPASDIVQPAPEDNPYSELPEDIQTALKFMSSRSKTESVDGVIKSSQEGSAKIIKQFEEMGLGETFHYLRGYLEDHSVYYNNDVMGENQTQREAVRGNLRVNLAIRLTQAGLDQARVEDLAARGYNAADGAGQALLFEGDVKDYIALAQTVSFGPGKDGAECLNFTSEHLGQYQREVYGPHNELLTGSYGVQYAPYCKIENGFASYGNMFNQDRSYAKKELEDLIKAFHD